MFQFTKATKEKAKARIALIGPSGCGKTYTALTFAQALGDNVAVIDTENGSASKYADEFEFNTLNLEQYSPQTYVKAIQAAQKAGFDVLIIDSLSHAWTGKGGALEMVDKAAVKYKGNSFAAWRDVTPHHNALVDALVQCDLHLIVTMRAKTAYEVQKEDGKVKPVKVGLAPVQRDGLEYEFDIVADMDLDHNFIVSKTRCRLLDNAIVAKPDHEIADTIKAWLGDGAVPAKKPQVEAQSNGKPKPERPMSPQQIQEKARNLKDPKPASDKQQKYAVSSLSKVCDDEYIRHAIGTYLFDKPSSKDWTSNECKFVIEWIGAKEDTDYEPTEDARTEVKAIEAMLTAQDTEEKEIPF